MYRKKMSSSIFRKVPHKAVTLLGMSGSGKTTLASRLPRHHWFHYSGDYRIGTRYMDEPILDNVKREAMKVPFLADLLRSESIYLCHNITINNLINCYIQRVITFPQGRRIATRAGADDIISCPCIDNVSPCT